MENEFLHSATVSTFQHQNPHERQRAQANPRIYQLTTDSLPKVGLDSLLFMRVLMLKPFAAYKMSLFIRFVSGYMSFFRVHVHFYSASVRQESTIHQESVALELFGLSFVTQVRLLSYVAWPRG